MACHTRLPSMRYSLPKRPASGRLLKAPVSPRMMPHSGIPIKNNPRLVRGPATAMCPFCRRVTRPATITAPGAMKRKPIKNEMAIPNCRPFGSARNSAQHPFFFATNLWPISWNKKAGPMAINITGMDRSSMTIHVEKPYIEIPPIPPTAINPRARVKAPIAKRRCSFSTSLKCHKGPVWCFGFCQVSCPKNCMKAGGRFARDVSM